MDPHDASGRTVSRSDAVASWISAMAMVAVVGMLAYRQWTGPPAPPPPPTRDTVQVAVQGWSEMVAHGERIGAAQPALTIVEFGDFECPYCRQFWATVDTLMKRYPDQVALVFYHYPLRQHRFANHAARAADCAAVQGRFRRMYDLLFQRQDSLGFWSFERFARGADVPDSMAFTACMQDAAESEALKFGRRLAAAAGVHGTPTVLVNGWRLPHPPNLAQLDVALHRMLAGGLPVEK